MLKVEIKEKPIAPSILNFKLCEFPVHVNVLVWSLSAPKFG